MKTLTERKREADLRRELMKRERAEKDKELLKERMSNIDNSIELYWMEILPKLEKSADNGFISDMWTLSDKCKATGYKYLYELAKGIQKKCQEVGAKATFNITSSLRDGEKWLYDNHGNSRYTNKSSDSYTLNMNFTWEG